MLALLAAVLTTPAAPAVVWRLPRLAEEPAALVRILGRPRAATGRFGPYLLFDGRGDGLVVHRNPIAGWPRFTVQALIKPDPNGPPEQRFFHIEDVLRRRLTLETRVDGRGHWALDAYLHSEDGRRPLLDRSLLHSAGEWHWVALRFDGRTMATFVDGRPELSAPLRFAPMAAGEAGIGVRLDRVFWYQGAIAELRFDPRPVGTAELEHP